MPHSSSAGGGCVLYTYITTVTRIRLLLSLAETICADLCTPARDHTVVCGNKTIPVCRRAKLCGPARAGCGVWIFYNGLLTCARHVLFAYQANVNFAYTNSPGIRRQQMAVRLSTARVSRKIFFVLAEMMSAS